MSKLTEGEVRAVIDARAASAVSMTALQREREQALDFYYGRPMGNEIDGRAQVVSKDVMDVIEWRMPSLLRVFATQDAVQFDQTGPDDKQSAREETGFIRHVYWKKNDGYTNTHDCLKDGLLQKNGYFKYWWQDEEKLQFQNFEGLTEDQLLLTMQDLEQNGDVEVLGAASDEDGLYSIKVRTKKKYGCAKIVCVPPDEVIVNRGCSGAIKTARFVGHLRSDITRGELVDAGYKRERVAALQSYSVPSTMNGVNIARNTVEQTPFGSQEDDGGDWASEELTLLECFTYIDEDDDGIAELRYFLLGGNDTLEDEEAPEIQWESWTPYRVPHRHNGLSEYDRMEDLQRIGTALDRGLLDNVYFTNAPRLVYDKNTVDTVSLGINRPGGHIANDGPPLGAVTPVTYSSIVDRLLPVIDYFDQKLETRTGVGRMSQGVDTDVLAQSTKGAYVDAKSSSNQITEAMCRNFAECLASLYLSLHRLHMRHQNFVDKYQLGSDWIDVDPMEWHERENFTVAVGLGNASKEETRANLGVMATAQEKAAAVPGLIQPQNVFALLRRVQVELGFENENFATDPASPEYKKFMAEQKGGQEDPYLTGEKIKAQTRMQEKAVDSSDKALDRAQERDLTITELEVSSGVDLATAGIGAEVALRRGNGAARNGSGAAPSEPAHP